MQEGRKTQPCFQSRGLRKRSNGEAPIEKFQALGDLLSFFLPSEDVAACKSDYLPVLRSPSWPRLYNKHAGSCFAGPVVVQSGSDNRRPARGDTLSLCLAQQWRCAGPPSLTCCRIDRTGLCSRPRPKVAGRLGETCQHAPSKHRLRSIRPCNGRKQTLERKVPALNTMSEGRFYTPAVHQDQ